MASGRPIKKPVKTNLLKARKDANEKALKSGFMKMPDYAKKKFNEAKDKDWPRPFSKSERDEFLKKKKEPSAYRFPDKDGKATPLYRNMKEEEQIDEISLELMGRHARKSIKQVADMQKLVDNPKTPRDVKKGAVSTIKKRSKGLDKTWGAQNESSTWLQRTADDWNDHADHPHPKVQKHIKKAEKAYNAKDYDAFHHHTKRAGDHAYALKQKAKKSVKEETPQLSSPELQQQLDELSPDTLKSYTKKKIESDVLSKKDVKNLRRAGQKIYDKEYSKTGKPVKDKDGKTVGKVHEDAPLKGFRNKEGVSKAGNLHRNPGSGPGQADADRVADALDKHEFKKKRLATIRKAHKKVSGVKEATADEVLKKRYASYHPDDNPQATKRIKDHHGMKTYKMHPGAKLTDRGYSKKGKMAALKKQHARRPEQYGIKEMMMNDLSEISPALKTRYIHGANKEISNLEKAKDSAHKDMGKDSAPVEKHLDRKATKRRKGVQQARKDLKRPQKFNSSKGIWEGYFKRQATAAQERQRVAALQSKAKKQSNKQTTTASKDPMKEEQKRVVESLGKLMSRGIDSIKKGAKQYADSQEKAKKAGKGIYSNPVSGDNIRKRLESQKKRLAK